MEKYRTRGTCSVEINFDVTNDKKVTNVSFLGGCRGNLQGISKLCENRDIDEVIACLNGINCRGGTSCPDQLAKALIEYKQKNNM